MEVPGRGCCMCICDCGCTVVRHGGYLMLLLRFAKRGGADVFITFRVFPNLPPPAAPPTHRVDTGKGSYFITFETLVTTLSI
mmetsp:Transcript_13377/g.19424  ORF Transcript_13377/g.19424 Transcript_13377/m.19424 type:complete len:82 (-) Transcript_13377:760-1005(-)